MDGTLNYGHICRVIKGVNSEIRQDRKESVGRGPGAGQVGKRNYAHAIRARKLFCACVGNDRMTEITRMRKWLFSKKTRRSYR